jgi:hypothetical protein
MICGPLGERRDVSERLWNFGQFVIGKSGHARLISITQTAIVITSRQIESCCSQIMRAP